MRMTRMRATLTQLTLARLTPSQGILASGGPASLSPVTPLPGFLETFTAQGS